MAGYDGGTLSNVVQELVAAYASNLLSIRQKQDKGSGGTLHGAMELKLHASS